MARLHEFEGKMLLARHGLAVPKGRVARNADGARALAEELGGAVVLKIQAWTTGRKALGGVAFAEAPAEAARHAERLLAMRVGAFPVESVLVEEQLVIRAELFVSLLLDDATRRPAMLISLEGGTGVEDRSAQVARVDCDPKEGPNKEQLFEVLETTGYEPQVKALVRRAVKLLFEVARKNEARSLEINPLAITAEGNVVCADCRMTIDDYAVFRHPDLGIDVARELDHPPTTLERVAYDVEQRDHRGTFYFAQLNTEPEEGSDGLIGFHGAGGGGSMMSMDAITNEGFTIANFCDTSGNPSAAKVYRAARIILSQPGITGYFGSGSGVASQEQFWSAYGLAKAFWETNLSIPAVIRLGGNSEDRAVEILEDACRGLPGEVQGYKKDDPPRAIAQRFKKLVLATSPLPWIPKRTRVPDFVGSAPNFPMGEAGRIWIDHAACDEETTALVVGHSMGVLHVKDGKPAPAVSAEELANKDSELIACEIECRRAGKPVVFVELDVPGLGE